MRMNLVFSHVMVGWDESSLELREGSNRRGNEEVVNESHDHHSNSNDLGLPVLSSGSSVVGAEEYWKEHTEAVESQSTRLRSNLVNESKSSPSIPIGSSNHQTVTITSLPHPFDPAFSPPHYYSRIESIPILSPQTSNSNNVDLFTSTSTLRHSSSPSLPFLSTTSLRTNSPPTEPYDPLPLSSNSIKPTSSTQQLKSKLSHTPEISEPMRFLDSSSDTVSRGLIEMGTQTEGEEVDEEGEKVYRSGGRSRKGTTSRQRHSSSSSSTSRKPIVVVEHQRGRSMSRSPSPHHLVIMPSTSSRNHSSARQHHQRQRTPSSSSPSPPLSPSNSFSSVTSLGDTDDDLEEEEEKESFEYDARFVDLPSLRSGLKERDPKGSSRTQLYCGEQYRLIAINKAKLTRTGAGYFNGIFNLD